MSDPRPGGSHRRVDRGARLRVLLLSLVVVVVAAGGVVYALHWRGESKRPTAAASGYPRITPSAKPSSSITPVAIASSAPPVTYPASSAPVTPAASAPAASAPAASAPAVTAPAATASTASPAPSTSASTPVAKPPVDILNSTRISGMAARAATTLSNGGWNVGLTGNYPHPISATTVFYPAGDLAAAQALAAQFTAIGKVETAPDGVSTTDLTLVLAQDWTASGK